MTVSTAGAMLRWGISGTMDPRLTKRIILSNQIAFISIAICAFYCVLYPLMGVPLMWVITIPLLFGFAGTPFFNRIGRTKISRQAFILVADLGLVASGAALGKACGIHLFLILSAWLILILFDWEDRKSMIAGIALHVVSLLVLEIYGPEHGLLYTLEPHREKLLHSFVVVTWQAAQIVIFLYFCLASHRTETALAQAGEEAKRASTAKSRFMAFMSHEFRTPLNCVLGLSDLLAKSELDRKQKDLVRAIHDSGLDLVVILDEIMDLSRIEAGKMRIDRAPFQLKNLLETVMRHFEHEALRKRLRLSMVIAPGIPGNVIGDSARLKQILNNLIGNALKFTSEGRVDLRVRMRARAGAFPDPCILDFEVEDTGIGIPSEAHGRIFQFFSQGEDSTKQRYGGTGLGLFISKQIVETMGGTIGFRAASGQGSVFHFSLAFPIATEADLEPALQQQVKYPAT